MKNSGFFGKRRLRGVCASVALLMLALLPALANAETAEQVNPFEGLDTGSILLIGGVLVMLLISTFMMAKRARAAKSSGRAAYERKRKPAKEDENAVLYESYEEYAARTEAEGYAVKCTSGPLAGKEYPVTDSVFFGRDDTVCNVVFPAEAAVISMIHCKLTVAEGRLFLTDLDSAQGTFLADGMKLAPMEQRELNSRDSFYLAKRENLFTVL